MSTSPLTSVTSPGFRGCCFSELITAYYGVWFKDALNHRADCSKNNKPFRTQTPRHNKAQLMSLLQGVKCTKVTNRQKKKNLERALSY